MINAGTIKIAGGTTTPAAPGAPVSILPAAPAVNTNNPSCLVQISQTSNKILGNPKVQNNVKTSEVKLLTPVD